LGRKELKPCDALSLLQSIYLDETQPLTVRIRCATEALPYENPKLSAVGVASLTGNEFAKRLEKAISRSGKAPVMIEGRAEPADAD
jgi:hypothetical protein